MIRLAPTELGHVQVRIERPADAPARVVLAVERPDTLMLLMRDQPQLNRALDAAGVPPDGRTLQFALGQSGRRLTLGRCRRRRLCGRLEWRLGPIRRLRGRRRTRR